MHEAIMLGDQQAQQSTSSAEVQASEQVHSCMHAEPEASGSSRSLSIDDLERRIEALNSTLQLHIDQRPPLSGLQSPATPSAPLQKTH